MKRIFLLSILSSTVLMSCSTPKPMVDAVEESITEEVVEELEESYPTRGEVTSKLYSKDKADTVESSIEYMFYENPVLPYQDSINRLIKTYVSGIVSAGGGATEQDSDLSHDYFMESIDKFTDEYKRQLEFVDGGPVWQTQTRIEIYQENPEFTEVRMQHWNYEGGAHGSSWSEGYMYDIKTGKKLLLTDFFSDTDALTKIAETVFRGDQELAQDASLIDAGFWFKDGVFHLNENFVFNENSVDFLFNQYEIAPYAAGVIVITIPMEDVKDLLKRKVQF